jgi:hypothetical protein
VFCAGSDEWPEKIRYVCPLEFDYFAASPSDCSILGTPEYIAPHNIRTQPGIAAAHGGAIRLSDQRLPRIPMVK